MADTRQYPNPGDKELPEVNADDEGKVLAVVKGAWDKAGSQIELPVVTSEDNGKLLGVIGGKWDSVNAPTELPAVTIEDNGRILQVASGAWTKQNMPTELPAVTASDNGKVLGVADGNWGVVNAPSGGGKFIWSGTVAGSYNEITWDKTINELKAALAADTPIFLQLKDGGGTSGNINYFTGSQIYPLSSYSEDMNEEPNMDFNMIYIGDGYTMFGNLHVTYNDQYHSFSDTWHCNSHNADESY